VNTHICYCLHLATPPPPFQFTPAALCTVYPTQPPKEGVLDGISNTSITKGIEIAWIPKDRAVRSSTSVYCHSLRLLAHARSYCYPLLVVSRSYCYYVRISDGRRRLCSIGIFLTTCFSVGTKASIFNDEFSSPISLYTTNVRMNQKGNGRKQSWTHTMYCPTICNEMENGLNSGNACYRSVQNNVLSHLPSQKTKLRGLVRKRNILTERPPNFHLKYEEKTNGNTILFLFIYGCNTWSLPRSEDHKLWLRISETKVLSGNF
jgi:hypothetical protein